MCPRDSDLGHFKKEKVLIIKLMSNHKIHNQHCVLFWKIIHTSCMIGDWELRGRYDNYSIAILTGQEASKQIIGKNNIASRVWIVFARTHSVNKNNSVTTFQFNEMHSSN